MDLIIVFSPSFHRQCSVQIKGNGSGIATFEVPPTGVLPHAALALPLDHAQMDTLRGRCLAMLEALDSERSELGLDGISIDGTYTSPEKGPEQFSLWSPRKGSAAHTMLTAVFGSFPFELYSGAAGKMLEVVRSYFDLQPPAIVVKERPLRLRLGPWVHPTNAGEIEKIVAGLPPDADLLVDASGMERSSEALMRILPMDRLQRAAGKVRWIVRDHSLNDLMRFGVPHSMIGTVPSLPITARGEPIVLGGLVVSSPALLSLAKSAAKVELVRAFRNDYQLTVAQAVEAAAELIRIAALGPVFDEPQIGSHP